MFRLISALNVRRTHFTPGCICGHLTGSAGRRLRRTHSEYGGAGRRLRHNPVDQSPHLHSSSLNLRIREAMHQKEECLTSTEIHTRTHVRMQSRACCYGTPQAPSHSQHDLEHAEHPPRPGPFSFPHTLLLAPTLITLMAKRKGAAYQRTPPTYPQLGRVRAGHVRSTPGTPARPKAWWLHV